MASIPARYEMYKGFFEKSAPTGESGFKLEEATQKAKTFSQTNYYENVFKEIVHIEHEADALYSVFQDSKHDHEKLARSGLVEMLAFTFQVLALHYQKYDNPTLAQAYKDKLAELSAFAKQDNVVKLAKQPEEVIAAASGGWLWARCKWLLDNVKEKFNYLYELLLHPSKLRGQLGISNVTRIYWVFCHFSINEMILIFKDSDILNKIAKLVGHVIDLDKYSDALNMPNDILNVLSVAFFGVRLLIDLIMLAKHTVGSNEQERAETTAYQRFVAELEKRFWGMTNCVVWGGVNLLTNYYDVFGIPVELAFPIVAGVLVFDIGLVIALHSRAKSQYMTSLANIDAQLNELGEQDPMRPILLKQREALNDKWELTQKVYFYNAAAAVSIFTFFSLSIILSAPAAVLACYMASCISIAMYGTADNEYASYAKACQKLEQASAQKMSASDMQALAEQKQAAFTTLVTSVIEQAFAPMAIFVLAAISLPAGLTLGGMYLGYKISQGLSKFEPEQNTKQEKEISLHAYDFDLPAPQQY
jgi:hypothetical protein